MKKRTSDALEILNNRFAQEPGYYDMVAEEYVMAKVSQAIYDARQAAGLTQRELADKIGTHQSVVARLEDGDYDKHSLAMLNRIARALGKRVEVRFTADTESNRGPLTLDQVREVLLPELRAEIRSSINELLTPSGLSTSATRGRSKRSKTQPTTETIP